MVVNDFHKEYSFLSNFAPAKVEYNGIVFPSVEHAYVASKSLDLDVQMEVAKLSTAGKAKRFGRKEIQIRSDFDSVKYDIMKSLLEQKFKNPFYRFLLSQTGDAELIEGNTWHDNYWGSCTCDYCEDKGQNNLGKLLMEIRSQITETKFDVVAGMNEIDSLTV